MYSLQWLKIELKIFSNRKIQILLREPNGDTYFRVWIQLLIIAVECNRNGKLVIGNNKPMTIENFSKIMGKSKKKIEKIIQKFLELNMLIVEDGAYKIKNWDKYQSIEPYEKYKEQNRIRQQKYREKLKSEKEESNVTITLDNTQEENKIKNILNKEGNENRSGFRKCEFCNKKLKPVGLSYLYANVNHDMVEYERCDCSEAIAFWKQYDSKQNEKEKQRKYREIINKIYKDGCIKKKLKYCNFLNFDRFKDNQESLTTLIKYTHLCTENKVKDGIIIYGSIGYENTHLAASIANEIIRNKKIALLERTSSITDRIKESFNKTVTTESEIMELYSNVDMLIIDDFGSETISKWALERLYRIINNRYENELPIVITTRYTREELMEKIAIENRKLAEEFIQILYKMCYGISLIKNDRNAKEKASKSDKTKC